MPPVQSMSLLLHVLKLMLHRVTLFDHLALWAWRRPLTCLRAYNRKTQVKYNCNSITGVLLWHSTSNRVAQNSLVPPEASSLYYIQVNKYVWSPVTITFPYFTESVKPSAQFISNMEVIVSKASSRCLQSNCAAETLKPYLLIYLCVLRPETAVGF